MKSGCHEERMVGLLSLRSKLVYIFVIAWLVIADAQVCAEGFSTG